MASERIPRHMEYIRNLVEAMLDILEIILNLPAARNRDLVALLAIGCLVALSLLRVMAAARNLLARVRARGRHARHNVREGGKGRQSRIARHARRGPYAAQDPLRGGTRTRTGGMTGGYASPVVRPGAPPSPRSRAHARNRSASTAPVRSNACQGANGAPHGSRNASEPNPACIASTANASMNRQRDANQTLARALLT